MKQSVISIITIVLLWGCIDQSSTDTTTGLPQVESSQYSAESSIHHDMNSSEIQEHNESSQSSEEFESSSVRTVVSSSEDVTETDVYSTYRVECLNKINDWRAGEGKPALARWEDNEECADGASKKEYEENSAHASFGDCGEWAQNLCPGYGSLDRVINNCLQAMWDEGPGEPFSAHGHYINMSSTKYSKVACGFYTDPQGKVWHIQDFK